MPGHDPPRIVANPLCPLGPSHPSTRCATIPSISTNRVRYDVGAIGQPI